MGNEKEQTLEEMKADFKVFIDTKTEEMKAEHRAFMRKSFKRMLFIIFLIGLAVILNEWGNSKIQQYIANRANASTNQLPTTK